MTVRWLEEQAPVRWLGESSGRVGLFSESTTAACQANLYNQDACYAICTAIGIGGWGGLLVWPCVNQCMVEACGSGILVDHQQMQKVGAKVSPCFNACMDAYQQQGVGTEEDELKKAAIDCGKKCGFGPTTQATAGGKKIPRPGSGGATTPSNSTTPAPTVAKAATGGGLVLVGLAIAAAVAYALTGGFK